MNLFDEFFKIVRKFGEKKIQYTLVGGVAMAFHDEPRFTKDIDFLTLPEEIDRIREALKEINYFESSEPWTFKSTKMTSHRFMKVEDEKYLMIDILLANEERHRQILARSIQEEWKEGRITIISKNDLIWMKKQRNSDQDIVDIRKLQDDKD